VPGWCRGNPGYEELRHRHRRPALLCLFSPRRVEVDHLPVDGALESRQLECRRRPRRRAYEEEEKEHLEVRQVAGISKPAKLCDAEHALPWLPVIDAEKRDRPLQISILSGIGYRRLGRADDPLDGAGRVSIIAEATHHRLLGLQRQLSDRHAFGYALKHHEEVPPLNA